MRRYYHAECKDKPVTVKNIVVKGLPPLYIKDANGHGAALTKEILENLQNLSKRCAVCAPRPRQ